MDCTNQTETQPQELDDDTVKQIINMDIGQNCRCDLNWINLNEIPPFDGSSRPDHLDQPGLSFVTLMTPSNSNNLINLTETDNSWVDDCSIILHNFYHKIQKLALHSALLSSRIFQNDWMWTGLKTNNPTKAPWGVPLEWQICVFCFFPETSWTERHQTMSE